MDKKDKYKGFINDKTYIIALGENKAGKRILPKQFEAFHEQDHVVVVPQAAGMMLEELLAVVRSVDKVKHAWITSLHSAAELGDAGCEDLSACGIWQASDVRITFVSVGKCHTKTAVIISGIAANNANR